MFVIDERNYVKANEMLDGKIYHFVVKEMSAKVIPTYLVTLDDEFFCQVDSLKEANDEIDYYADEKDLIEVVY